MANLQNEIKFIFKDTTATRKIFELNKRIRAVSGGTGASKTISILIIGLCLIITSFFIIMEFKEAINRISKRSSKIEKRELKQLANFEKKYKEKRSQDIIQALDFNEKIIVNYLLTHNKYSYANLIEKSIGMPKRSIRSTLLSIREKGIVKLEEKNEFLKVSLTKWFLER